MSKEVGQFVLENDEKVERALHGTVSREGKLSGGVGDSASDMELLAEYDKLGGLITKDGVKVKTGSFFNLETKKPRKEPELSFLTEIDGEIVEVDEEEAKAVKATRAKIAEIKSKKAKAVASEDKPKKVRRVKKEESEE